MKKVTLRTLFFVFCISPLFAFATNSGSSSSPKVDMDELRLIKQHNTSRSTSEVDFTVYTDNETLVEIVVSDYIGNVSMQLSTGRGTISMHMYVNGFGVDYLDFSKLRGGTYTLTVNIDGETYIGTIVKPATGGR